MPLYKNHAMGTTAMSFHERSGSLAVQPSGPAWALAMLVLAGMGCAGCDVTRPADKLPAAERQAADPLRGQRLLTQYQCGSCHAIPGVAAARGLQGPSLAAFGKRSYIAGHIPNGPDALARWIMQPAALVPDTLMPSMGVALGDARDMAAYLGSLQ